MEFLGYLAVFGHEHTSDCSPKTTVVRIRLLSESEIRTTVGDMHYSPNATHVRIRPIRIRTRVVFGQESGTLAGHA